MTGPSGRVTLWQVSTRAKLHAAAPRKIDGSFHLNGMQRWETRCKSMKVWQREPYPVEIPAAELEAYSQKPGLCASCTGLLQETVKVLTDVERDADVGQVRWVVARWRPGRDISALEVMLSHATMSGTATDEVGGVSRAVVFAAVPQQVVVRTDARWRDWDAHYKQARLDDPVPLSRGFAWELLGDVGPIDRAGLQTAAQLVLEGGVMADPAVALQTAARLAV